MSKKGPEQQTMWVQFIFGDEKVLAPLSALRVPRPIPDTVKTTREFPKKRPHINPFKFSPTDFKKAPGELVDCARDHILECYWDNLDKRITIKAEYPGMAAYMKKFDFHDCFRALWFWRRLTFLYYHRFQGLDLKESAIRAEAHGSLTRNALIKARHKGQ